MADTRKKASRIETKCNLTLPVTVLKQRMRYQCGKVRWTPEAAIIATAFCEAGVADIVIEASKSLLKDKPCLSAALIHTTIMNDPTYKNMFREAVFNLEKPKRMKRKAESTKAEPVDAVPKRSKRLRSETQ
jgi:hypothetical protein